MSSQPSFAVRLGLFLVRGILRGKAMTISFFRTLAPMGRFFVRTSIRAALPVYRVAFSLKKHTGSAYRPVKNRLMFVMSNRWSVHVVVVVLTVFAGVTNIRVNAVRAEADAIGQRSILYALATNERMEFVEEYNDPAQARALTLSSSASGGGVLVPSATLRETATPLALATSPGLFRADGAFALSGQDSGTRAAAYIAPRTEIIAYTVESGDTLSTIAEKFGISLNTLLWANNLSVRSVLRPGNTLSILPVSGIQHTVKSGDTLLAIAKKYGVDASTIASYNALSSEGALQVGQQFVIPGGVLPATVPVRAPTVAIKDVFTSAPSGSQGSTAPVAGFSMIWPTDLRYIVRKTSWFHTGYDIDCNGRADGTSTNDNYAAADGVVIFAGAKRGYGNAVEIDHGNGLITRYGHFHSLYVSSGEAVSMGDPLGRCGSTGNSTGTHLHFEVIDAATKKFLNPGNYIR